MTYADNIIYSSNITLRTVKGKESYEREFCQRKVGYGRERGKGIKSIKRKLYPDDFERAVCPLTHTLAISSKPVTVALLS